MTGWKDWQVGEVVEEVDFQSLIQNQVVQVYDSSTQRASTLGTAVAEGMVSYLKDIDAVEVFDSSAWVQIGGAAIQSIVAGTALSGGGTAGTVTINANLVAIGSGISITAAQISDITATATELNYVDGVTSAIQTQIDGRVSQTNGTVTTAAVGSVVVRNIALSTATPSGGMDGDVWLQYTP
jgi:hypothetical protein